MPIRKGSPSGMNTKILLQETRVCRWWDIFIDASLMRGIFMSVKMYWGKQECKNRRNISKLSVITNYTKIIGRVDTADHYTSTYFLCRCARWWQKLFFWGLDAAIVNFYCLYRVKTKEAGKKSMTHLHFRRNLVEGGGSKFLWNVGNHLQYCTASELWSSHFQSCWEGVLQRIKQCQDQGSGVISCHVMLLKDWMENHAGCSDREIQGGHHVQHVPGNQAYIHVFALKFTTPRWTTKVKTDRKHVIKSANKIENQENL